MDTKSILTIVASLIVIYFIYKTFRSKIPINASKKANLNVIIIGASRGIGLGLARSFLSFGDNLIIASSKQESINRAYNILSSEYDISIGNKQLLRYIKCDVTNATDLHELFAFASKTFEDHKIDIIINNFGVTSSPRDYVWNIADEDIHRIVSTNLTGIILSNKICIKHYIESGQNTPLHIFNQGGAGTNAMVTAKFLTYGATKGAFLNIMNTLNGELKSAKLNERIFCHTMTPGMVWTNLLANRQLVKDKKAVISDVSKYWIVNALTDTVENATKWLVLRIRGIATASTPKAGYFPQYLTKTAAFVKIVRAALFGYNSDRFIDKNGFALQEVL